MLESCAGSAVIYSLPLKFAAVRPSYLSLPCIEANIRNRRVNGHVILQLELMVGKPLGGCLVSMQYWIIDSAAIISKDKDEFACV